MRSGPIYSDISAAVVLQVTLLHNKAIAVPAPHKFKCAACKKRATEEEHLSLSMQTCSCQRCCPVHLSYVQQSVIRI